MGIVQIALDPPSPLANGQTWKKSAPNHPDKPLHPWATWEKSAPNHSGKPYGQCPYMETTHFKKGVA